MATIDPEEALIQHLIHNTAINALVAGRVYPKRIPQGDSVPAITVMRVDTSFEKVHGEPAISKYAKTQVTSWADTLLAAKQLAAKVESALDGYMGVLGYGSSILEAEAVTIEGENFDDDEETGLNWVNQDYAILITP